VAACRALYIKFHERISQRLESGAAGYHYIDDMRALCVARHPILSDHLARFFERFDIATVPVVGMRQARSNVSSYDPDLVLCDYGLLTPTHLERWRADPASRGVPIVAVSMTKRPADVADVDGRGLAGFIYLPTIDSEVTRALFATLRRRRDGVTSPKRLSWPGTTPVARRR
jgi:DNA-binding response OmpR family regulator